MPEVKWIKIVTDVFDDEKVLLIESMPEADAIIVIWFKLLCLAGKNNNKGVFTLNDRIAYTDEMIATIFRRNLNTVRMALKTFEDFGMIEIINGVITIPNWSKYQTLDQIDARREYQRTYMEKRRAEQKQLTSCKTNCKPNCETNSKQDSEQDVNPIRIEVDKEERDKEERELEEEKHSSEFSAEIIIPQKIEVTLSKQLFSLMRINNPKCKEPNFESWSKNIDLMIRVDKRSVDDIMQVIAWCQKDDFWKTNILSTEKLRKNFDALYLKMTQIKKPNNNTHKAPQETNYEQRKYDTEFYEDLYYKG